MPNWPPLTAPSSVTFGDLLRHHRLAAGLTQEELAARAQLSVDAISTLERGARTRPRKETVALLAEALALSPEDRQSLVAAARRTETERVSPVLPPALLPTAAATAPTSPSVPTLQTFLIADIRGSTRFAVEHGDEAWARLTMRFAAIAAKAVTARGGQVVELRGAEALAVFASARAALHAAVELQLRLASEMQADPTLRLHSGIGLDAGEAVSVEGGFRGLALNLAARLCSLAGPGEVLASETVIALAHRVEGLAYTDRGLASRKGFTAPVRVLQVSRQIQATLSSSTSAEPASSSPGVEQRAQLFPIGGFLGALPSDPLVARQAEVDYLRSAVETVAGGAGRLVLLVGEPGVGKTRLAQELTLLARDRGFLVASGRCYAPQETVAYYPFLEVLGTAFAAARSAVRERLPRDWPDVFRLLPNQPPSGTPSPTSMESGADGSGSRDDQQRLFWQVTGFLLALSGTCPVALLFDDLHWADTASLNLLQHLARHTRSSRLLLVGTYRGVEVGRQHPLETALRDLSRERLLERLPVGRLSQEGTRELMAAMLDGQTVAADFAQALYSRTEGNPFFTEEVLRALVEQGDLYRDASGWGRKTIEALAIPESVRTVLGQRLSHLDALAQEVLSEASVLGQTFAFDELLGMAAREETVVEVALQEAVAAGLVHEVDADHFNFRHALIQQTLYQELPARKRRKLHRAAGEALEKLPEPKRRAQATELAWHFLEADEAARPHPYTLLAGDACAAVSAHAEAKRHYRTAADLAAEVGDRAREAEAYEKLARPTKLLGRANDSRACYEHAIELYQAIGDRAGELRAYRWLLDVVDLAELKRAQALAGSVVEAESGPEVLRGLAALYNGLGSAYPTFGCYHEALAASGAAERIARGLSDDGEVVQALLSSAVASLYLGEDVLRSFVDLRPLAEHVGDLNTLMWTLIHTGLIYLYDHADLPRAKAYLEQAQAVAERRRSPYTELHTLTQWAAYHYYAGEWGPARECAKRATIVLGQIDDDAAGTILRSVQGMLELAAGRNEEAEHYFGQVRAVSETSRVGLVYQRFGRGVQAERDLLAGDGASALTRLEPLLDRVGMQEREVAPLLPLVSWAQLALDRDDGAAATLVACKVRCGKLWLVDALRVEALLAIKHRRWQNAAALLDQSLSICRAMPYPYAKVKGLYIYGQLHAVKGQTAQAREQYEAALAICERLGEGLYRPHIERVLADLDLP